jgi:hypothetical protein
MPQAPGTPSEPKGRGTAWTAPASRRAAVPPGPRSESDEGRRRLESAPEASGSIERARDKI